MNLHTEHTFGQKIRFLRTKKKMKQLELAKGICSVSYLSKVENDSTLPSDEIKELLLDKLGLNSETIDIEQKFYQDLHRWNDLISKNEINEAQQLFDEVSSLAGPYIENELLIRYKIFTLHYYVAKRDFLRAAKIIKEIDENKTENPFSSEINYYYQRYVGKFYYYQLDFIKAYDNLYESEKILPPSLIEKDDKAELYYSLAFSSSKIGKSHQSISYTKTALDLFQSLYNLKRCVDCHVLLGITYRLISNFEESIEHYQTAQKLAKTINYNQIIYTIKHNLGGLYSIKGDSQTALSYYFDCYNNKGENISPNHRIDTIFSIIEEYYKNNEKNKTSEWIRTGKKFIKGSLDNSAHYISIIDFYKNLLEENFDLIGDKLEISIIPYFKDNYRLVNLSEILRMVADRQYNDSKYKSAAEYHALSRDCLLNSLVIK